jgi:hypothetical protein
LLDLNMTKTKEGLSYAEIRLPDLEARKNAQDIFVAALVSSAAAADKGAKNALALAFAGWLAIAPVAEPWSRVLTDHEGEKQRAAGAAIMLSFVVAAHAAFCRGGAMSAYTRAKRLGVHEAVLSAQVDAADLFAPLPYAMLTVHFGLLWWTLHLLGFAFDTLGAMAIPTVLHFIFLLASRCGRTSQWRQEFEFEQLEDAERPVWLRRFLRKLSRSPRAAPPVRAAPV